MATKAEEQEKFEAEQKAVARTQNLGEGAVPEKRPIANQTVSDEDRHSGIYKKLREAGDPRAGAPAMDKEAYDRAASDEQRKKAARKEQHETLLHPGARAWIDNPDSPDHGRAVAVNSVAEFKSTEDERIAAAGTPQSRFAKVKSYNCRTRDGRAEFLVVSAEDLKVDTSGGADWGKTPLTRVQP